MNARLPNPTQLSKKVRSWTHRLLIYVMIASIFFLIGFTIQYNLPRFKAWVLVHIESLSRAHLPVLFFARDIEFKLWPLGISFIDVRAQPRQPLAQTIAPLTIKKIDFDLSVISLLLGQIRLKQVIIEEPLLAVVVKELKPEGEKRQTFALLMPAAFFRLPVDQVLVKNGELLARIGSSKFARVEHLSARLRFAEGLAFVEISTSDLNVKQKNKTDVLSLSLYAKGLMDSHSLQLSGLKVQKGRSYLVATGQIKDDPVYPSQHEIKIQARSAFQLNELNEWIPRILPDTQLPELSGQTVMDVEYTQYLTSPNGQWNFKFESSDLLVNRKFNVGDLSAQGFYLDSRPNTIYIKDLLISNQAGQLGLRELEANIIKPKAISAIVFVNNVELSQFLVQLGLKKPNLYLPLTGELPCQASFEPGFQMSCQKGRVSASSFWVKNKSLKEIVALGSIEINGDVNVDSEQVRYDAQISLGATKGSSKGKINYAHGFEISYLTDGLSFSDIKNLAHLKFEGTAALNGKTQGDSSQATMEMMLNGKNLWFEDYFLGHLGAQLSYKKGHLSLQKLDGLAHSSHYKGRVLIDLDRNTLDAQAELPNIQLSDLTKIFNRKVTLPLSISGTGQGKVKVSGPFDFSQLTYKLTSNFVRGEINNEGFDQIIFNVHANHGNVIADKVQLKKGSSQFVLTGKAFPTGQIDVAIDAHPVLLEELRSVTQYGQIRGQLQAQMILKGHVLKPRTHLDLNFSRVSIRGRKLPDSRLQMGFTGNTIEGKADLFDHRIRSEFIWPLDGNAPFRVLLTAQRWDFTPLFGLVSDEQKWNYQGYLVGEMDLSAASGGFWNSTGKLSFTDFRLQKDSHHLQLKEPVILTVKDGLILGKELTWQGDQSKVSLKLNNTSRKSLNVEFDASIEVPILAFLFPFFDDFRGNYSSSLKMTGTIENPAWLGSAYLSKSFIKIRNFPHPIENLNGDFLFSQRQVMINSLRAQVAGGDLLGRGVLKLVGPKNFPLDFSAQFNNVTLLLPDGVKSSGSGELTVTGSWFPYQVGGRYAIRSSQFAREFNASTSARKIVQQSSFLPKLISNESFSPFLLNLDLLLGDQTSVRNSQLEGLIRGNVSLTGPIEAPALVGTLTVEKNGIIYFRDTQFEVLAANAKFDNEKPNDPIIYVSARSRVQDYDVNIIVQGRSQDPSIQLTSQPLLPEKEIISLLALGMTSSDLEKSNVGQTSSLQVGSAILSKPLNRELEGKLPFSVKVQQQSETLGKEAVPKVRLSFKLNPRVEVSAGRSIGKDTIYDGQLEYKVNRNLSVVGRWEDQTNQETSAVTESEDSRKLGLDLQYKLEFR